MTKPSYRELSDESLMTLIAARDRTAFAELQRRYEQRVLNLCRYMGRRDAEDIAQETFLRVWERAQQCVRVSPWVFTIARHLCLDEQLGERRRNRLAPTVPLQDMVDSPSGEIDATQPEMLYDQELAQIIEGCLNKLGPLAEIIRLHYFAEMTVEDIADLLKLSIRAAKYKLYERGLKKLRECLERHLPDEIITLKGRHQGMSRPKKYQRGKKKKGDQS